MSAGGEHRQLAGMLTDESPDTSIDKRAVAVFIRLLSVAEPVFSVRLDFDIHQSILEVSRHGDSACLVFRLVAGAADRQATRQFVFTDPVFIDKLGHDVLTRQQRLGQFIKVIDADTLVRVVDVGEVGRTKADHPRFEVRFGLPTFLVGLVGDLHFTHEGETGKLARIELGGDGLEVRKIVRLCYLFGDLGFADTGVTRKERNKKVVVGTAFLVLHEIVYNDLFEQFLCCWNAHYVTLSWLRSAVKKIPRHHKPATGRRQARPKARLSVSWPVLLVQ